MKLSRTQGLFPHLEALPQHCPAIEHLELQHCIDVKNCQALAELKALKYLDLGGMVWYGREGRKEGRRYPRYIQHHHHHHHHCAPRYSCNGYQAFSPLFSSHYTIYRCNQGKTNTPTFHLPIYLYLTYLSVYPTICRSPASSPYPLFLISISSTLVLVKFVLHLLPRNFLSSSSIAVEELQRKGGRTVVKKKMRFNCWFALRG